MPADIRKNPVGRPRKVVEAAAPVKIAPKVDERHPYTDPEVQTERTVEVEILRKYAPYGQKTEIQAVVYPGTIMKLPVPEATRALKYGIARATDNTFEA